MVVGLTGQTGAGKSTVGQVLRQNGLAVIDCDQTAREVVLPGSDCLREIARVFGGQVLVADGGLNRKKMAEIIFSDAGQREIYNKIIHSAITKKLEQEIALAKADGLLVLVLDAPTLFESGADRLCDRIVSVLSPQEKRFERILLRDGLTPDEAKARMAAQQPDDFYAKRSDLVLQNSGSLTELGEQAQRLADCLQKGGVL